MRSLLLGLRAFAYAPVPSDEPFLLTIMATLNHRDNFAQYACSVEVDEATRTVQIHVDAMLGGECLAIEGANHEFVLACEIPALEAGQWTFSRTAGPGAMTLELPQDGVSECDF